MDDAAARREADGGHAFHEYILDQMDVAVIATDRDRRVTAWNRAAEALFGWPAARAIGRPIGELVGPLSVAGEQEAILAQLDRGEPVHLDQGRAGRRPLLLHDCRGRPLIVEGRLAPIRTADGALIGYVAAIHDVTEHGRLAGDLAESEAKYRNLVELSPDAILIHQDGVIVFANPAAALLVGADDPSGLIGRPVLEIVLPGARRDVEWNIAADLRGEESPITTVELVRRDGTIVVAQGRGARIPLNGRPAIQVILRDVTGREAAGGPGE